MEIIVDDLSGPEIASFLAEHLVDMQATSPPESIHALDLDGLRKVEITFWSVYSDQKLVGCGALKELDRCHGEIKSMRTTAKARGLGVASAMLKHIIEIAESRGYQRISLETGSMSFFEPARKLYAKHGFTASEPFANYKADPNSVFMSKKL